MDFYAGSRDFLAFIVRATGLVVMILGLWLALEVLHEAWQLYHEPARIERFAKAIEAGSNIDRSIAPLQMDAGDSVNTTTNPDEPATNLNTNGQPGERAPAPNKSQDQAQTESQTTEPQYRLQLSYYIAWVIVLMLLLVLARIALGTMRTGGELVLYETQMKRFARELVRETLRGKEGQDK